MVVPSRQRAAALRLAHAVVQLSRGRRLWTTPDIQPLGAWLEREAARGLDPGGRIPRVLRESEEWLVWRDAARRALQTGDLGIDDLPPTDALVEGLRAAARLRADWQIPARAIAGSPESDLLAAALRSVEEQCAALDAASRMELPGLLLESGTSPSRETVLAGFVEHPPAIRKLLQHWIATGPVSEADAADGAAALDPTHPTSVTCAEDARSELAIAARWCARMLEQTPGARLLVIVPDLARRRAGIARAFEHALAPELTFGTSGGHSEAGLPFALEGGRPLVEYPLVAHALFAWRFLTGSTVAFAELSAWLRSSFWRAPDDASRARLDAWLRGVLGADCSMRDLAAGLTSAPSGLTQTASRVSEALHAMSSALPERTLRSGDWSQALRAGLSALGWPGARTLGSAEQQALARLDELLEEFAALGSRLGELAASEAVHALQALAERVFFEPATGDVAVTLTAALADPVVRYDGIWVCGLSADVWPPPPRLDPFVPAAAQRAAGVTAADHARLLERSKQIMARWQRAARVLVLSWPRGSEEGESLPSPLLAGLPAAAIETLGASRTLAESVRQPVSLERFQDPVGAAWPAGAPLPGGTRTIEHQVKCPFRAYAELRLRATPLEIPRAGVDYRARGQLLHRALDLLWANLRDSQTLARQPPAALDERIRESVSHAMLEIFGEDASVRRPPLLAREERRAASLIRELCRLELERAPFTVVAREALRELRIGESPLEVRVDRIDRLEDGTAVIVDYKTGRSSSADWLGERITHPQLPLYALAAGVPVSAFALVHLTADRVSFRGVADKAGRLPKVGPLAGAEANEGELAWSVQMERWRRMIERAGADFIAGRAARDPLAGACRLCHVHAFCRIADPGASAGGLESDESEGDAESDSDV